MNYRDYIIYDFETTSKYAETTQPIQLAAIAVNGRTLEVRQGSEFNSLIKPEFDLDKCRELNLDPLTDESIAIHGKTAEMLADAPLPETVWANFVAYAAQYQRKPSNFHAPIPAGYNIDKYDSVIVDRLCRKEPYAFGPVSSENQQSVFSNYMSVDVMKMMFQFFENDKAVSSLSADNLIRKYMGYIDRRGKAHDALSDVYMTYDVFARSQRFIRDRVSRVQFKGIFNNA